MSEKTTTTRTSVFPWFMIFFIGKVAAAKCFLAWSWWWMLLPIVPCVVEFLRALGMLS